MIRHSTIELSVATSPVSNLYSETASEKSGIFRNTEFQFSSIVDDQLVSVTKPNCPMSATIYAVSIG